MPPLHGAPAAAVTPLPDQGARLDEAAIGPLVQHAVDGGLDGVLALGTTGEGILARLRDAAPNLAGLKVSDTPFGAFRRYLLEGLDVFVGPERLILHGMAGGAAGAVSGLAAAFPSLVADAVRAPTREAVGRLDAIRTALERAAQAPGSLLAETLAASGRTVAR